MNLLIQNRSQKAMALMERVLRDGESIAAEYPLVFGAGACANLVTVEEEGEVRSACTCLVRDAVLPGLEFRVGLIGSVVTDPRFEGQGLASSALAVAEQELRAQGCLLALLWADSPEFYAKRGYDFVGEEIDYLLDRGNLAELPEAPGTRRMTATDAGEIHRLYAAHAERLRRSEAETRSLLAVPGMEVLVLEEGDGLAGYACVGRGKDLGEVVHEWGGSAEAVSVLLREFWLRREERGEVGSMYLMTPASAEELHARLDRLGAQSARGVLGMGKLLNWGLGVERLRETVTGIGATLHVEGDEIVLETAGGRGTLGENELVQVLFAARGERGVHERLEQAIGAKLEGLPWKPFVWGLDSI